MKGPQLEGLLWKNGQSEVMESEVGYCREGSFKNFIHPSSSLVFSVSSSLPLEHSLTQILTIETGPSYYNISSDLRHETGCQNNILLKVFLSIV